MVSRLNPYLTFDGQARAAMQLYQDVFGGDLDIRAFGDFGQTDPGLRDRVMHAMLVTASGFTLMGSDLAPGMPARGPGNVTVSLSGDEGDDGDELRRYWSALSEGGSVQMPLEKQMWGDEFGLCTDRFGIEWMVDIGSS